MKQIAASRLVAVVSQLPPPVHGSTIMTGVLLKSLENLGHRSVLVDKRFSTSINQVGKPSLLKIVRIVDLCRRLGSTILRQRPDLCVFFATTRPGSLLVDWLLTEILTTLRVPLVAYLHTIGYRRLSRQSVVWSWIIRRFLSRFQEVVILSKRLETDIESFAPLTTRHAIANTVAEELPMRSMRKTPSRKHVVFISNLIPDKGAKDFIVIAKKVLESYDAHFSLIGATADQVFTDELELMICRFGLSDKVQIIGPLYGAAKWEALENATALVFPSRYEYEAQPLTIIESLLVGTPILAYRTGAIEDCVVSGVTGWVVEPGEVDKLANNLCFLLSEDQEWLKISNSCQKFYAENFSHASYERKWNEILS